MYLIGLSGKIGAGKDTAFETFQQVLHPHKVVRIAFADALKEEVATAAGVEVSYINDHKDSFRRILQGWATEFRRDLCNKDYWIARWMQRVTKVDDDTHTVVCTDVRFKNEVAAIHSVNGWVFRIRRPTYNRDEHSSETELSDTDNIYNGTIYNNKDREHLYSEVQRIIAEFKIKK
jgi:hypothetical protein